MKRPKTAEIPEKPEEIAVYNTDRKLMESNAWLSHSMPRKNQAPF